MTPRQTRTEARRTEARRRLRRLIGAEAARIEPTNALRLHAIRDDATLVLAARLTVTASLPNRVVSQVVTATNRGRS